MLQLCHHLGQRIWKCGPYASSIGFSPGDLLETPLHRPFSGPTGSEMLGVETSKLCFNQLSSGFRCTHEFENLWSRTWLPSASSKRKKRAWMRHLKIQSLDRSIPPTSTASVRTSHMGTLSCKEGWAWGPLPASILPTISTQCGTKENNFSCHETWTRGLRRKGAGRIVKNPGKQEAGFPSILLCWRRGFYQVPGAHLASGPSGNWCQRGHIPRQGHRGSKWQSRSLTPDRLVPILGLIITLRCLQNASTLRPCNWIFDSWNKLV